MESGASQLGFKLGFPIYWVARNGAIDNLPHSLPGHKVEVFRSAPLEAGVAMSMRGSDMG